MSIHLLLTVRESVLFPHRAVSQQEQVQEWEQEQEQEPGPGPKSNEPLLRMMMTLYVHSLIWRDLLICVVVTGSLSSRLGWLGDSTKGANSPDLDLDLQTSTVAATASLLLLILHAALALQRSAEDAVVETTTILTSVQVCCRH